MAKEFVPRLVKNRSILDNDDPNDYEIASCKVMPVTTDGTYMMSLCRRVKVDLRATGKTEKVIHLDLVIKVSDQQWSGIHS